MITLTKSSTGANTITHLLHFSFSHITSIYGTQIPALGFALISAWTRHPPCFISIGPLGPCWSVAIAIPCTVAQTFISITINMEAQGLIYGLVCFPMHPPRALITPTPARVILTSSTCQGNHPAVHSWAEVLSFKKMTFHRLIQSFSNH